MRIRPYSLLLGLGVVLQGTVLLAGEADFVTAVTAGRHGIFEAARKAAMLDGKDGDVVTTQSGGVSGAGIRPR